MPPKIDLPKERVISEYKRTESMEKTAENFGVSTSLIHSRLHDWDVDINIQPQDIDKVERKCPACGNEIHIQPWRADKHSRTFCDAECMSKHYEESGEWSGENSPIWKGGIRYGNGWVPARRKARERDCFTCQMCGITEEELGQPPDAHHITPVNEFKNQENAHYVENLILLCRACHMKVERMGPDKYRKTMKKLGAFK